MKQELQPKAAENLQVLYEVVSELKQHGLNEETILNYINKQEIYIPLIIFRENMGSFETIVKYLKENLNLSNKKISIISARNNKTIWASYNKAKQKSPRKFNINKSSLFFPVSLLKDRRFSVLETLVAYLKEELNLSYHEIAIKLKRNDRTIWTVYQRYLKKVDDFL